MVNQYANKGLIIIAATATVGIRHRHPFQMLLIKAKDTFNIDAEGLRDKGVVAAPSEHKIWFEETI